MNLIDSPSVFSLCIRDFVHPWTEQHHVHVFRRQVRLSEDASVYSGRRCVDGRLLLQPGIPCGDGAVIDVQRSSPLRVSVNAGAFFFRTANGQNNKMKKPKREFSGSVWAERELRIGLTPFFQLGQSVLELIQLLLDLIELDVVRLVAGRTRRERWFVVRLRFIAQPGCFIDGENKKTNGYNPQSDDSHIIIVTR
ncbi:hypothetical protein ACFSO0_16965 [Brevibacillus sp. GCM10020057]|uniref:hypothetical protein n=1 Tax=Brevibacillus sp. GCM10020057 TaxID=3317327 RepID=UPI0036449DC0